MWKAYHSRDTLEFVEQPAKIFAPHVTSPGIKRMLVLIAETLDCADDGLTFWAVKTLSVTLAKQAAPKLLTHLEEKKTLFLPQELHKVFGNLAGVIAHMLCEIGFTGKRPDYTGHLLLIILLHAVMILAQNYVTETLKNTLGKSLLTVYPGTMKRQLAETNPTTSSYSSIHNQKRLAL